MKNKISLLLVFILCFSVFFGCANPADVLDENVDDLQSDYLNYTGEQGTVPPSVLDTLDMMLDEYVSDLQKPDKDDIQHTDIDPGDDTDLFKDVDNDCVATDEMRTCLLQALTDTEDYVEFYIDASAFSSDILYDVIFNQLCEEYMIETLGMQSYSYTTMPVQQNRYAVKVDFEYFKGKYSLDEVKEMKVQTLDKAKEIVRTLDLANKSEADCVYAVNEYLCDNCVYPDSEPYSSESHTPYGSLIEKSAVCDGYARAAQLIFSLCNVESYFVVGDTPAGGHAWNLVKVDGEYYQLDVTWNDVDSSPNMYLLVTDDYMSLSRTWDRQKYPASSKKPY